MKNSTSVDQVSLLATIQSATYEITNPEAPTREGTLITIQCEGGEVVVSLAQFDAIYAGFVRCWPTIRPAKTELALIMATNAKAAREEKKASDEQGKADRAAARDIEKQAKLEADKAKAEARDVAAKAKADEKAAVQKAKDEATEAKRKADEAASIAKKKADEIALAKAAKALDKKTKTK